MLAAMLDAAAAAAAAGYRQSVGPFTPVMLRATLDGPIPPVVRTLARGACRPASQPTVGPPSVGCEVESAIRQFGRQSTRLNVRQNFFPQFRALE
jgi:hypothetical protein